VQAGFRLDACDRNASACIELAPGGELRAAELRTQKPARCGCSACELPDTGEYTLAVQSCDGTARKQSERFAIAADAR
jgi:hypothetical protein